MRSPDVVNASVTTLPALVAIEPGALAVRGDLVDDALVARRGEDVAGRIHRERPDVLVFRIEERLRRAVLRDVIDPPVRRRAHIQPAVRRGGERVHFELGRIEERREFAVLPDLEDLSLVAAAGPQRAIRRSNHGPQERRGGFGDERRRWSEEHPAVVVDGQIGGVPFEEIRLRRDGPEGRGGGDQAGPGTQKGRERKGPAGEAVARGRPERAQKQASRGAISRNRARGRGPELRRGRRARPKNLSMVQHLAKRRRRTRPRYRPAGARASTSMTSVREPMTAESMGTSHCPTAALRIGV